LAREIKLKEDLQRI